MTPLGSTTVIDGTLCVYLLDTRTGIASWYAPDWSVIA